MNGDTQRRCSLDHLCLYVEILARLAIRQEPSLAIKSLNYALELAKNPSLTNSGLFEAAGRLAENCIEAVPLLIASH